MEIDYYAALSKAWAYYDTARRGGKFNTPGAVKELAALGLFNDSEIAKILNTTVHTVRRHTDIRTLESRVWNVSDLDTLMVLAYAYHNKRDLGITVWRVVRNGNSIKAVSELTGMPLDTVRRLSS